MRGLLPVAERIPAKSSPSSCFVSSELGPKTCEGSPTDPRIDSCFDSGSNRAEHCFDSRDPETQAWHPMTSGRYVALPRKCFPWNVSTQSACGYPFFLSFSPSTLPVGSLSGTRGMESAPTRFQWRWAGSGACDKVVEPCFCAPEVRKFPCLALFLSGPITSCICATRCCRGRYSRCGILEKAMLTDLPAILSCESGKGGIRAMPSLRAMVGAPLAMAMVTMILNVQQPRWPS